jgi:uncharacterized membrane protein YdjX (TVP38/TMEM64 family)
MFAMPSKTTPSSARTLAELVVGIAAIVAALALVVAVPPLRHCVSLVVAGHFSALRSYIGSLGAGGVALLLGLMLAHAVIWFPSEIVTATAGFVYGFVPGLALALGGWLLCGLATYAIGRSVGRPVLQRALGHRFDVIAEAVERGGVTLLIGGRLIPVIPFALLGIAAGATQANLWRFAWTTVVGYLPLTAAVAYLGARAQTLSLSSPILWLIVVLVLALLATGSLLRRRIVGD